MKVFRAICFVAGTAIGAGMLALPLGLAKLGILGMIGFILTVWVFIYWSALLNMELVLQAKAPLPLAGLAKLWASKNVSRLSGLIFIVFCYILMVAYMDGCANVINGLFEKDFLNHRALITVLMLILAGLLCTYKKYLASFNHILILIFFGVLTLTLILFAANLTNLQIPLTATHFNLNSYVALIPLTFCSFGFHIIFHIMATSLNFNAVDLKRAFFWGSLIPAIVYILWCALISCLLYQHKPEFFCELCGGGVSLESLMLNLKNIVGEKLLNVACCAISLLAMITSAIGLLIGFVTALQTKHIYLAPNYRSVALALIPVWVVCMFEGDAFLGAMSFAGLIMSVMAVLIPAYLLTKVNCHNNYYYKIWSFKSMQILMWIVGVSIMAIEVVRLVDIK